MKTFTGIMQAVTSGMRLTHIGQHFSRPGLFGVSRSEDQITDISKWRGKKVGYWITPFPYSMLSTVRSLGLNETRDFQMVPQGFTSLSLVEKGENEEYRYDVVSAMIYNEYAMLLETEKTNGVLWSPSDFHLHNYEDYSTSMFEDCVAVSSDWLLSDPQNEAITTAFLKASIKGWAYCRDNEEECVKMMPDKSAHQYWQLREVNKLIWPTASPIGLMYPEPVALSRSLDIAVEYGIVSNHTLASSAISTKFVERALEELRADDPSADYVGSSFSAVGTHEFCLNKENKEVILCSMMRRGADLAIGLSIAMSLVLLILLVFVIVVTILCCFISWQRRIRKRMRIFAYAPKSGECTIVFSDIQESMYISQ